MCAVCSDDAEWKSRSLAHREVFRFVSEQVNIDSDELGECFPAASTFTQPGRSLPATD
jgi:hypothetical protein